jgi:hypothetical protein
VLNKEPEYVETGRLGERSHSQNGVFFVHMSRLIDGRGRCKPD